MQIRTQVGDLISFDREEDGKQYVYHIQFVNGEIHVWSPDRYLIPKINSMGGVIIETTTTSDTMLSLMDIETVREATGCGVMDAKKALLDSNNHVDKAIELVKQRNSIIPR